MSATTPTMAAIGLDVRATAPGDEDAEGIAAGQIALDEGLVDDGATGTDLAGGKGVALVEIAAGEEANAEGGEETGADGVEIDDAIGHDAAIGLHGHFVAPGAAGEEGKSGSGGGTGGGQGADLLVEAADQARGVGVGNSHSAAERWRRRGGWTYRSRALWPAGR